MRLLIISNMAHYLGHNGSVWGWGPTVEEINYLAKAFISIRHVACLYPSKPTPSSLPYNSNNIKLVPVAPAGGPTFKEKYGILLQSKNYTKTIINELKKADIVHVRCPANISLLAIIILSIAKYPKYSWVKYAGNWAQSRPPISYKFQRWWLSKRLHHGAVTINGEWPGQKLHIFSFQNPCLMLHEIQNAKKVAFEKFLSSPLKLLYVGRVEEAKGVGRALEICKQLKNFGFQYQLDIIGDGPEREFFENKAIELSINNLTKFHGWLPKPHITKFYSKAHFFVLPTNASEGFPKVVSEAMAYGAVPIIGAVSCIKQVLKKTGAGVAVEFDNTKAYVETINYFIQHPEKWKDYVEAGTKASIDFTYEKYLESLDNMFYKIWGFSPINLENLN